MSKYEKFRKVFGKAVAKGLAAGYGAIPDPMVVTEGSGGKSWFVRDGVCGFAWVTVRPGTSSFARWLVKTGQGRKAYGGGVDIWVSGFGQSMQRKEAYAYAMAKVITDELGVSAYAGSRMD